jgi:hypothetical protein
MPVKGLTLRNKFLMNNSFTVKNDPHRQRYKGWQCSAEFFSLWIQKATKRLCSSHGIVTESAFPMQFSRVSTTLFFSILFGSTCFIMRHEPEIRFVSAHHALTVCANQHISHLKDGSKEMEFSASVLVTRLNLGSTTLRRKLTDTHVFRTDSALWWARRFLWWFLQ